MSNLQTHAKQEFIAAGWCTEDGHFDDDMQELICEQVCELLKVFSQQGHSGCSAPYLLNLFNKLAKFESISPITGQANEWCMVTDNLYQNIRCSAIFKNNDDRPYYIEAIVFEDNYGGFTGSITLEDGSELHSRGYIKSFPYTPETFYLPVKSNPDGTYTILDQTCLEKASEYYNLWTTE